MKKHKKILFIFLAVTLFVCMTAFAVSAKAYSGTCGKSLTWSFDTKTGVLDIRGKGAMTNYSDLDERPWDRFEFDVESINIGNGVTSICEDAFYAFGSLKKVTISDTVSSIGQGAFRDCGDLENFSVGACNGYYSSDSNGVLYNKSKTIIVQYPIGNSRKSFAVPNTVSRIDWCAFYECDKLTSVTIPDSVKSIGVGAFEYCTKLENVKVGKGLKNIEWCAFEGCWSLENLELPDSVTKIESSAFEDCKVLVEVKLGNNIKTIEDEAFYRCAKLKAVEIPASVDKIGLKAFGYYYDNNKDKDRKVNDFKISGYKYSRAEKYATDNGFTFVSLGEIPHNHEYKTIVTKATTKANGKIKVKCSICGKVSKKTVVAYPKTVVLNYTKKTYTGKELKPTVTVKDSTGKVVDPKNYTVSYKNNIKVGKATVTITFKGNYTGKITKTFTIIAKAVTDLKVTSSAKKTAKITFTKATGASGYEIYYSTKKSSDFKKLTSTTKTSYTYSKLTSGKTYYFKVRAYTKLSDGTKIYGAWSSIVSKKIK